MTDTELSDIASAAATGLSRMPKAGQSTPAATADSITGKHEYQVLPDVAHRDPAQSADPCDPGEVASQPGHSGKGLTLP
jgi:hypothetical protein